MTFLVDHFEAFLMAGMSVIGFIVAQLIHVVRRVGNVERGLIKVETIQAAERETISKIEANINSIEEKVDRILLVCHKLGEKPIC